VLSHTLSKNFSHAASMGPEIFRFWLGLTANGSLRLMKTSWLRAPTLCPFDTARSDTGKSARNRQRFRTGLRRKDKSPRTCSSVLSFRGRTHSNISLGSKPVLRRSQIIPESGLSHFIARRPRLPRAVVSRCQHTDALLDHVVASVGWRAKSLRPVTCVIRHIRARELYQRYKLYRLSGQ
jgi:hypothetical protein